MKIIIKILSVVIFLSFISCENKNNSDQEQKSINDTENTVDSKVIQQDETAIKIKNFLNNDFLNANDKKSITENDKKFSYKKIDLNNDGKNEIFVYLRSPYYCGSGGCTFLLLTDDQKLINTFTVTRPPIYTTKKLSKGWKNILIKSDGQWRELTFNGEKYPSNPSIIDKKNKTSKNSEEVIFEENGKEKIYSF